MACTETGAGVCMEELVEPEVIAPIRIKIEFVIASVTCSAPVITTGENMLKAVLELLRDVAKVHIFPRTLRAFNLEGVAIEHIEA